MRPGRQVESVPAFFCQRRAFNLPKRTGEHEAMRKIITHKQAKALRAETVFHRGTMQHGHIAERLTNCRGQCVECNRAQDRKRYAANPEKKLAKKRRRYAVNPEKILRKIASGMLRIGRGFLSKSVSSAKKGSRPGMTPR